MDNIKKAYVDSRFRTRDSNSDSELNLNLTKHWIYQMILHVIPMISIFHIHGEQLNLITTGFI